MTLHFEDLDELCSESFRQFVTSAVLAITQQYHVCTDSGGIPDSVCHEIDDTTTTGSVSNLSAQDHKNLADIFAIEWAKADKAHKEQNAIAELDADFAYALALQEEEEVESRRGYVDNVPIHIDGYRQYKDELADPNFLDRKLSRNLLNEQVIQQLGDGGTNDESTCDRKKTPSLAGPSLAYVPMMVDGRGRFTDKPDDMPGDVDTTIEYRRKSIRKLVGDMISAGWRPLPVSLGMLFKKKKTFDCPCDT